MRYASIDSKIRKANGDDSALQFTVRTGGQHKTMLSSTKRWSNCSRR